MVLSSEAEISSELGPIQKIEDEDAQIDPAIAALSPDDAKAVAEGQVYIVKKNQLQLNIFRVKLMP